MPLPTTGAAGTPTYSPGQTGESMARFVQQRGLWLGGAVIALLWLLAVSLPALTLKTGTPVLLEGAPPPGSTVAPFVSDASWLILGLRAFLALALLVLPLYILVNLMTPEGRRRLLTDLVLLAVLWAAASWLADQDVGTQPSASVTQEQAPADEPPLDESPLQRPPEFIADPQPWMLAGAALVLATLSGLAVFWIARQQARHREPTLPPLDDLARGAKTALDALDAGEELGDVIVACYAQMGRTLRDARGIERGQAMTAAEFEGELLSRGFPAEPIHVLTRLFEQVRYGRQSVGDAEKQAARASLESFLAFCRGEA